ncbi:MAG: hypothetical protein ABIS59_01530 [Candidatus Saccharibacteria bacterium]
MTTIAKLLAAKEPLFDTALAQLEHATGKKNIDTALAAEIATTAADRTKRLGLDTDCTGEELYAALLNKVKEQDEHLAKAIGGTDANDVATMIPLIVKAAENAPLPKDGWFIKEDKAREMLKRTPPTAIMERLGYHLVSQLLEHEDIYELYLALRFVQDPDWLNAFDALYDDLTPEDFEPRSIKVVPFALEKWGDIAEHFIAKKRHNITHSKEMGAIAVMPLTQACMDGICLKIMPLLFHYFNEIRLYSAFFQLMKTKKNFGHIVAETLIAEIPSLKLVEHGHIHWRVIQRYFGKLANENHPEIFEPHVQPEDLHWRRAEEVLYAIDPELDFWQGLDFVGIMKGNEEITFNLMDVSLGYSNSIAYPDRYLYHFRESLWNEVFARYMTEKVLEDQLLIKLDNAMIKPETLVSTREK